jgi:hypothetical protein
MKLPPPRQQLAGCIWLPRIIAKARALSRGELEPDYAARFCHPGGIDGQFLSFFRLAREGILSASGGTDEQVISWFHSLESAADERVAEWNRIALNLGRPGFPMAERMEPALATTYKHLNSRKFETVFEVLEADEGIS